MLNWTLIPLTCDQFDRDQFYPRYITSSGYIWCLKENHKRPFEKGEDRCPVLKMFIHDMDDNNILNSCTRFSNVYQD